MLFHYLKRILLLLVIGYAFALPQATHALSVNPFSFSNTKSDLQDELSQKPLLEIRIPGLNFGDVSSSSDETGAYVYISWIPELITALYKFGIAIASIVAVVMIIVQGVQIIISGGNTEAISTAYSKISHAVIGLFIAWGSFVILYTINPKLTEFNPLKIKVVQKQLLSEPEEATEETVTGSTPTPIDGFCVDPHTLTAIKNIPYVRSQAYPNLIGSDVIPALKLAGEIASQTTDPQTGKKFDGLMIISAVRTLTRQSELFEQAVKKYGSEEIARSHVGKPQGCSTGSSHLSGQALDIHLVLNGKVLSSSEMTEVRINLFQDMIMTPAGWIRYCPEWWHFEVGAASTKPLRSTQCDRPYGTGNSSFKK
jgi:hypothetical protein